MRFAKMRRSEHFADLRFGSVASPPSDVVTRQMTAEEREALEARLAAKKPWTPASKPSVPPEARQYPTKDVDTLGYRKEQFLQLRSEGKTVEQIATEWGMREKSLRNNYLMRWGVNKAEDEIQALRAFAGAELPPETGQPSECVEVEDVPYVSPPMEREEAVPADPDPVDVAPGAIGDGDPQAYITIRIPLTAETALCTSATELRTQIRDDVFTLRRKIADIAHGLMEWTGSATPAEVQAFMDRTLQE